MYDFAINCNNCNLQSESAPVQILGSAVSAGAHNRVTGDAGQAQVHLCGCKAGAGRILVPSQVSNGHASSIYMAQNSQISCRIQFNLLI